MDLEKDLNEEDLDERMKKALEKKFIPRKFKEEIELLRYIWKIREERRTYFGEKVTINGESANVYTDQNGFELGLNLYSGAVRALEKIQARQKRYPRNTRDYEVMKQYINFIIKDERERIACSGELGWQLFRKFTGQNDN